MKAEKAGEYAFLVCILVALIAGLATPWITAVTIGYVSVVLVILGIVIGLTTITEKETTPFLVAAIALVVTAAVGGFLAIDTVASPIGTMIQGIISNIATFTAIAAIIIAVKAVYALASKK
ncbi:MAG: hypothetical protein ABIA21_03600 [Candidatus Aenigmatarchaeota archaeon]